MAKVIDIRCMLGRSLMIMKAWKTDMYMMLAILVGSKSQTTTD
jgi:hypothetical protein